MFKYKKRNMNKTIILLVLVLVISIGYAALTTVLKINSEISLGKVTFGIHFDNVQQTNHKATVVEDAHITDEAQKEISFNIGLSRISDFYKFTTDIVNEGTIPGKVKSIEINGLTESQRRLISYKVFYTGTNKLVSVGDFFGPESRKNVTVEVTYYLAPDVTDEDLPTDTLNLECEFIINFENGDLAEFRSRAAASKLMQDTHYMNSSALNFSKPTTNIEYSGAYVLASTENDDFPIYFYRGGSSTPNHVLFGGYCWRIIRTTDTGGIKIIYNGLPTEDGQCTATGAATETTRMNMYKSNILFASNSAAKTYLSSWYFANLIDYQAYLEDTVFCNNKRDETNGNIDIAITCSSDEQISVANGRNSYPVGLITVQEATLCGQLKTGSSYGWLHTGSSYWTMSMGNRSYPFEKDVIIIDAGGNFYEESTYVDGTWQTVHETHGMRPVVSLNSEVVLTDGDGTSANPYHVSLS